MYIYLPKVYKTSKRELAPCTLLLLNRKHPLHQTLPLFLRFQINHFGLGEKRHSNIFLNVSLARYFLFLGNKRFRSGSMVTEQSGYHKSGESDYISYKEISYMDEYFTLDKPQASARPEIISQMPHHPAMIAMPPSPSKKLKINTKAMPEF